MFSLTLTSPLHSVLRTQKHSVNNLVINCAPMARLRHFETLQSNIDPRLGDEVAVHVETSGRDCVGASQ